MASAHQQPQTAFRPGARKNQQSSWPLIVSMAAAGLTAQYFLGQSLVIKPVPSTIEACLNDVCGGRSDCVQFPGDVDNDDSTSWVRPYNLGRVVVPSAVVRPKNAQEVANVVKCASRHNVKVQAKAGGHSYGNYGLGGQNGAISIDLEQFQYVQLDTSGPSHNAKVGGGTRLGQIDEQLRAHHRAIPHGVCASIGIGGHATVGGLGPASRMWGTTLDHVEEVEVVTANGTIARASARENSDLFFAMRGAGAGFGIVTEFVMRTHAAPESVLHFNYNMNFDQATEMADVFHDWQSLVADPSLDRRLDTEIVLNPLGARISATWYGTESELDQSGILDRLAPASDSICLYSETWYSSLSQLAMEESLHAPDAPNKFYSKSLGFTQGDGLSKADVSNLFGWLEKQRTGSSTWSIKFQAAGGAVLDVPTAATAFAHRDKVMFYQSYAMDDFEGQREAKNFVDEFHRKLSNSAPGAQGTYPGFVDPELRNPQQAYWGDNLRALEDIKLSWDPEDVFHNPQSVNAKTL